MDNWLQQLVAFLPSGFSYLVALFIIAFAESLPLIGLAVPGSTLIVFAGFLAAHGKESLLSLMIASTAGALLGDLLSFWLGMKYGSTFFRFQIFQNRRKLIRQSESLFIDHGGKSIFFARFLGPIRGITPFIAGLSGMPRRQFYIYVVVSAILWGLCYPGLGYIGGNSWQRAQGISMRFALIIFLLLCLTIIHYWIKKKFKNDRPSSKQ